MSPNAFTQHKQILVLAAVHLVVKHFWENQREKKLVDFNLLVKSHGYQYVTGLKSGYISGNVINYLTVINREENSQVSPKESRVFNVKLNKKNNKK